MSRIWLPLLEKVLVTSVILKGHGVYHQLDKVISSCQSLQI